MKYFLILFLSISIKSLAQDSLFFRNGAVKTVKLLSSGSEQITYMGADSITYIIDKKNLYRIKHSGGAVETIEVIPPKEIKPETKTILSSKPNTHAEHPDKIYFTRNRAVRHGKGFGENKMMPLAKEVQNPEAKKEMVLSYYEMKRYKRIQMFSGIGGPVGGGVLSYASFIFLVLSTSFTGSALTYMSAGFFGLLIGVGLIVAGIVISKINKNKRLTERDKFINTYNKTLE
jgi:hypothetical protein